MDSDVGLGGDRPVGGKHLVGMHGTAFWVAAGTACSSASGHAGTLRRCGCDPSVFAAPRAVGCLGAFERWGGRLVGVFGQLGGERVGVWRHPRHAYEWRDGW